MRGLASRLLAAGFELAAIIFTSTFLGAHAIEQTAVPSPHLDLSSLGRVALAGQFDTISLYTYEGQNERGYNRNGSQSLLARYPNGDFQTVFFADAHIEAMCSFTRNDEFQGVVLGGNFTSLDGTQARSAGMYHPQDGTTVALPGLTGKVNTLFCDSDSGVVYFGGTFSALDSTNAMSWTTGWTSLPFAGFNGPVNSITKNAAGNIIFAGQFGGLGNASTPSTPDVQVLNLGGGEVNAANSIEQAEFSDPRNIICNTGVLDGPGNTWLLGDGKEGWWEGLYSYTFKPTKLRLYNTNYEGRGTKTFYFENLDTGGILNLEYIDVDGKNQSCQLNCPLPQNNSTHQDFYFVPSLSMSTFRIYLTDYYGAGAGLAGIEMFQDEIYSFAINDFNEPQCSGVSDGSGSAVTPSDGIWKRVASNGATSSDYLSASYTGEISEAEAAAASVVFMPSLSESGNYSIMLYTPGCLPDDSCDSRGPVNVTGTLTSDGAGISTAVFQSNNFDKFDQIYYGYVDATSDSFAPSVTLSPIAGNRPQTVVAQRVRFDLVTTTGGLNGLFEFNPNNATVDTDFEKSNIDAAAANLDDGATFNAVVSHKDRLFVGGTFKGESISNIMSVESQGTALPGGGLNDNVESMHIQDSTIYIGGNFTNTADESSTGFNNIVAFNPDDDSWTAMGAGVNGAVTDIVLLRLNITTSELAECISVNGDFTQINAFGDNEAVDARGIAIWVPSRKNWLDNIPNHEIAVEGRLYARADPPDFPYMYAGQISSQQFGLSGAVELVGSDMPELQSLGITLSSENSSSTLSKRAIDTSMNYIGVYTGLFYTSNNQNLTILGGHFTATLNNGATVQNLLFLSTSDDDKQSISGLGQLDAESTVAALDYNGDLLFAGGALSGTVDGNDINGLVVYNLADSEIASPQPPALGGSDVTVKSIRSQPDASAVYVGGSFDMAGSLTCPTLCYYDTETKQWNVPGFGIGGTINTMFWSSDNELIIAGDLEVSGNKTSMATYDAGSEKQEYTPYPGASELPGPISALVTANQKYDEFWAAGTSTQNNSAFLAKFSDDTWTGVGGLGDDSNIRAIQLLSLGEDHTSNDLVPADHILLVLGHLVLPGFGNASAALFNGESFTPFILSNNNDGSEGSIASIFVGKPQNLMGSSPGNLALGLVVLIGMAIALFIVIALVGVGLVLERRRREREGYIPMNSDRTDNVSRIPPESLLSGLREKNPQPRI